MTKTVYVFGAGINRRLCGPQDSVPPLATDLFILALNHPAFADMGSSTGWWAPLFEYIERYWKRSVDDLRQHPFDMEECFTLLQLQVKDAQKQGDFEEAQYLIEIISRLTVFFSQYLERSTMSANTSAVDFITLGKVIWAEKSSVLTFNYDTLIENTIEEASGQNSSWLDAQHAILALQDRGESDWPSYDYFNTVPDELVACSRHNWEPFRAYGVKFDEVMLSAFNPRVLVDGKNYFNHRANEQCQPLVLKMHGSLNWGRYVGHIQKINNPSAPPRSIASGTTILGEGSGMIADHLIEPLIITPMLFKNLEQDSIIVQIWQQALTELKACDRLIIGGYSFPPTDFFTRKLFLEAFADRQPGEVIVINPDKRIEQVVFDLTHVEPQRFEDLAAFINSNHRELIDPWDEQYVERFRKEWIKGGVRVT